MNNYQTEYDAWEKAGAIVGPRSTPEEVKWHLLIKYAQEYNLNTLVETGTAVGDTLKHVHGHFDKIYSFELMSTYYESAWNNLRGISNIQLYNESSTGQKFKDLVASLNEPVLFYLDAHYSGPGTGQDKTIDTPDVPVRQELETIITNSRYDNVIIVDDARVFKGQEYNSKEYEQYPTIQELFEIIKPVYSIEHIADAFILTPSGGDSCIVF